MRNVCLILLNLTTGPKLHYRSTWDWRKVKQPPSFRRVWEGTWPGRLIMYRDSERKSSERFEPMYLIFEIGTYNSLVTIFWVAWHCVRAPHKNWTIENVLFYLILISASSSYSNSEWLERSQSPSKDCRWGSESTWHVQRLSNGAFNI